MQRNTKKKIIIIAFYRNLSVLLPYRCRFQNFLFLFFAFKIVKEPLQIG